MLFIASHNTEKNLLIALLAKEINPHLNILARADNANVMNILEKAGVRKVVIPEIAIVDQFMIDLDATEQDNRAMKKEIENIVKDAKTVDVLK